MSQTLQQTINFVQPFGEYSPLTVGTGNEPGISIASMTRNIILNPPFIWPWNRAENSATSTIAGTQDYVLPIADFGFLEKVSLTDPSGAVWEIKDVFNTSCLAVADTTNSKTWNRPASVSVKAVTYGTNVSLRFLSVPNMVYAINVVYQKLSLPFASTGDLWSPIPDSFMDIFNNLYLGEYLSLVDDARSAQYRQRGIVALLSKSEGLSELQKSAYLAQFLARDAQGLAKQLTTQQGNTARGV